MIVQWQTIVLAILLALIGAVVSDPAILFGLGPLIGHYIGDGAIGQVLFAAVFLAFGIGSAAVLASSDMYWERRNEKSRDDR
jgi:Mn2+/Fe2+ NRAMP family transporter